MGDFVMDYKSGNLYYDLLMKKFDHISQKVRELIRNGRFDSPICNGK